jgi:uncharacterized protein YhdP
MARALPKLAGRIVWPLMVVTLVSLAVYVSSGRLVMRALSDAEPQVSEFLSSMVNEEVSIGGIRGEMAGFSPRLQIENFAIRNGGSGEWLNLPAISIRLDAWASFMAGELRFDELVLTRPVLNSLPHASEQGRGFPPGITEFLSGFERLEIREARLMGDAQGTDQSPLPDALTLDMDMVRDGSRRDLRVTVRSDEEIVFATEGSGIGDPLDYRKFSGAFHGFITGGGLGLVAQALGVQLVAEGSAKFWLNVSKADTGVSFEADLKNISSRNGEQVFLEGLSFTADLAGLSDQPRLWIQNAKLTHAGSELIVPRLQSTTSDESWQILSEDLDVASLADIVSASAVLPDRVNKILTALDPSGRIDAISLEFASWKDPLQSWTASLAVTDATTRPYRRVPGLGGIDASLTATQDGAQAWVRTKDFALELPLVYETPIQFDAVTGVLSGRWQSDALFLQQGVFEAVAQDHTATVQFEIDIPFFKDASIEMQMRLAAALSEAPIKVRDAYIPRRLPENAYQWLRTALPSGDIEKAAFLWFGGFKPYGDASQTMQLAANLRDVTLAYQNGWPEAIQAHSFLRLDDTLLEVWSPQTVIAGLTLDDASAGLQLRPESSWLSIQSKSVSAASDLKRGLNALPPLFPIRPLLDDLSVSGSTSIEFSIDFDLRDIPGSLDVKVSSEVTAIKLHSALLDLSADEISGALTYDSSRGFESSDLSGKLLGKTLAVEMGPHLTATPRTIVAAKVNFDAGVRDILEWRSLPASLPIDGTAPLQVAITVADEIVVEVDSDLQGVSVDLPLPWGKPYESTAPLTLVWRDRGWAEWEVFWFGRFSAVADIPQGDSATVAIDVTPRTRPAWQSLIGNRNGIHVTGLLPELDPAEWLPVFQDDFATGSVFPRLAVDDLRVEQLQWRGTSMGSLNLSLRADRELFYADFVLPWLRGDFQQQFAAPMSEAAAEFEPEVQRRLSISYLDIDGLPALESQAGAGDTDLNFNWHPLPVEVSHVYQRSTRLGEVDLVVTQFEADRWQLAEITGNLAGVTLSSGTEVSWQRLEDSEATSLSLAAQFSNLETSLTSLGVAPIVQTRSGKFDVEWSWAGSPRQFQLGLISGSMDLTLESGSFTSATAETAGAMRLLSLMNLAGLFRRANMNQLFDPGVTFDRAEGHMEFDQGTLQIPDFSIEGSGGYFTFASDVDLLNETLDGELVVTLPLVDNIPWVAALAGGLPIAAGTYLVSKVFEKQMNQLSSGVYSVSGDLNDPEVVFRRVFDATATAPASTNQSDTDSPASRSAR